jgi:hypothetical protein
MRNHRFHFSSHRQAVLSERAGAMRLAPTSSEHELRNARNLSAPLGPRSRADVRTVRAHRDRSFKRPLSRKLKALDALDAIERFLEPGFAIPSYGAAPRRCAP